MAENNNIVRACPWHVWGNGVDPITGRRQHWKTYGAFEKDAKRREKLGQKAKPCPDCGHYLYPDEVGVKPADLEAFLKE